MKKELYCSRCKTNNNIMDKPYCKRINRFGKEVGYFICLDCKAETQRKYYATPNGSVRIRAIQKACYERNRKKARARAAVRYAIINGALKRPSQCSKCNSFGLIHAHHPNYHKPLHVKWLCKDCHVGVHKMIRASL